MNLGIIGLPQTGKKTVFELLTGIHAQKAVTKDGIAYAMAAVRDPRVDKLSAMYKPKRTRYAEFEMALPPDIQPDASRNAGWIEPLRRVDALLHVVRAFEAPEVFHIKGDVNPARDYDLVETELLLADLGTVETRLTRMAKEIKKKGDTTSDREEAVLKRCQQHLETGAPLLTMQFSDEELKLVASLKFLTLKPVITVFNTGENISKAREALKDTETRIKKHGAEPVYLSASIEKEMLELSEEERAMFMADLGIEEPAAHRLSRAVYASLGLISFFTVGPDEVKAWPLRAGTRAPQAAGKIHTDLERGFIRAVTITYDHLIEAGSEHTAKEKNYYALNGKDYVVKDGDVIEIRFNV
ncbi:MAG TPA: redox-regulated ATPase YchF [Kiritimatiellia bacterium]|nr:redox-regulated ATPase YchF [Kiritimatiellia bacterium]HQQ04689.1 redox-regulated ATPase YchF [Kiritimatiellia bacterium]